MSHGHGHAEPDHKDEDDMSADDMSKFSKSTVLIKEGFLTKAGGKKKLFGSTSWKKRWFQMTTDVIAYSDSAGGDVKGGILLETITECRPAKKDECTHDHGIAVDTNVDRKYVMCAANVEERDAWITAINSTMRALNPPVEPKKETAESAAAAAMAARVAFEDPIEVGYWKIRGLGSVLRMMCFYSGYPHVSYKNYEIHALPDGGWDRAEWFCDAAKDTLRKANPLINLPYVKNVKTGQVITQTNACIMYLARRLSLAGNSEEEICANEQLLAQIMDFRDGAVRIFYADDNAEHYTKYFATHVKTNVDKLSGWLEHRRSKFLVGAKPSAADFHFFEMLDQHELCSTTLLGTSFLQEYPRLEQYYMDFKQLPEMQSYLTSAMHSMPLNNKSAKFGGTVLPGQSSSPAPLYDAAS